MLHNLALGTAFISFVSYFSFLLPTNHLSWFIHPPVTEYYKMPKLYLMDDYDLCMDIPDNLTVYCITTVILKPNVSLALWEYIDEFSRNRKKHFRHDRLQRGVCVNKCQAMLGELDEYTLQDLYQPEFVYENEASGFSGVICLHSLHLINYLSEEYALPLLS